MSTISSRRWNRWQLIAAAIALAAIVATVATLSGRGGPPVIRIAGSASGAQGEAATAGAPAADAARMSHAVRFEFELTDGARFAAGTATARRLEAPGDLRAAAASLAAHFGLGEPTASPHGDGGYQAGPQDGSGPSLWVGASGDWFYSDPSLHAGAGCAEPVFPVEPDGGIGGSSGEDGGGVSGSTGESDEPVEADPGDGSVDDPQADPSTTDEAITTDYEEAPEPRPILEPCQEPTPPAGVPSADAARRAAVALFAELGLPGTPEIVDVYADEWGAWVGATIPVGGQPTDLYASAGFGAEGALVSASGTLAKIVRVADYPTVDAEEAVERLEAGGYWGGGVLERLDTGVAVGVAESAPSDPSAGGPDEPVSSSVDTGVPGDDTVSILPVPEPSGEVETMTVRLVSAEPILTMHFDADQTVWLLPGVRFHDDNGGIWQVMTVADGYIEFPEPEVVPEPLPVEPAPDPAPPPGAEPGTPAEPGEPGASDPGRESPSSDYEALAEEVVGLTEAEATDRILAAGAEPRVVSRDGESYPVTDDYRTDRINLHVEDGIVVRAEVG